MLNNGSLGFVITVVSAFKRCCHSRGANTTETETTVIDALVILLTSGNADSDPPLNRKKIIQSVFLACTGNDTKYKYKREP